MLFKKSAAYAVVALIALALVVPLTSRAEEPAERPVTNIPDAWHELDWSLANRGVDIGGLRVSFQRQSFTMRQAHWLRMSFGNAADRDRVVLIEEVTVIGGSMAAERSFAPVADAAFGSIMTAPGESVTFEAHNGATRLTVSPGQLVGIHLTLPHDLDPDTEEATRGTCYSCTVRGLVDKEAFELSADLCHAERRPLH